MPCVYVSENNKKYSLNDKDRGITYTISAIGFNIGGLGGLALGNIPTAGALLTMSIVFLVVSLFYSTREYRQTKKKRLGEV